MNLDVVTGPLLIQYSVQLLYKVRSSLVTLGRRQYSVIEFPHIATQFPFLIRIEELLWRRLCSF